jgi:hypothetical protein
MANDLNNWGASVSSLRVVKRAQLRGQSKIGSMNIVSADEIQPTFKECSLTSHGGVKVFANGTRISVWVCDLTETPEVGDLCVRSVMPIHAFNVNYVNEKGKWSVTVSFGDTGCVGEEAPAGCLPIKGNWSAGAYQSIFGSKLIPVAGDKWMELAVTALWEYLGHVVGRYTDLTESEAVEWTMKFLGLQGIPLRDLGFLAVDGEEGIESRIANYCENPDCSSLMDDVSTFYIGGGSCGLKAAATRLVGGEGGEISFSQLAPKTVHLEHMPTILVMPTSADCLTAHQPLDYELVNKHSSDILEAYLAKTGEERVGKLMVYKHNMMAKHALLISDTDTELVLGNAKIMMPMIVVEFLRVGMVHLRNYIKALQSTSTRKLAPFDTVFPISPLFLVGRALRASGTTVVKKRVISKVITLLMSMWTTGQIPTEIVQWYQGGSDHILLSYLMEKLYTEEWMTNAGAGEWHDTVYINEWMVPMYIETRMSGANMAIVETSRRFDQDFEDVVDVTGEVKKLSWADEVEREEEQLRLQSKRVSPKKVALSQNSLVFKEPKKQHFAACYLCGKPNHIAKFCPQNQRQQPQRTQMCYNCGGPGHIAVECQSRSSPNRGRGGYGQVRRVPPQRPNSPAVDFMQRGRRATEQRQSSPAGEYASQGRAFKDMNARERSLLAEN